VQSTTAPTAYLAAAGKGRPKDPASPRLLHFPGVLYSHRPVVAVAPELRRRPRPHPRPLEAEEKEQGV
jgi:hypothetical protein